MSCYACPYSSQPDVKHALQILFIAFLIYKRHYISEYIGIPEYILNIKYGIMNFLYIVMQMNVLSDIFSSNIMKYRITKTPYGLLGMYTHIQ